MYAVKPYRTDGLIILGASASSAHVTLCMALPGAEAFTALGAACGVRLRGPEGTRGHLLWGHEDTLYTAH